MKRSKWKGPLIKSRDLEKKLPVLPRDYQVISSVVGLNCMVHSGKKFVTLSLTEDMIGHKLGEFVPTRERFEFKKKKKKK